MKYRRYLSRPMNLVDLGAQASPLDTQFLSFLILNMQGRRACLVLDGRIVAGPEKRVNSGDLAVPTDELESVLGIPCDQRSVDGDTDILRREGSDDVVIAHVGPKFREELRLVSALHDPKVFLFKFFERVVRAALIRHRRANTSPGLGRQASLVEIHLEQRHLYLFFRSEHAASPFEYRKGKNPFVGCLWLLRDPRRPPLDKAARRDFPKICRGC